MLDESIAVGDISKIILSYFKAKTFRLTKQSSSSTIIVTAFKEGDGRIVVCCLESPLHQIKLSTELRSYFCHSPFTELQSADCGPYALVGGHTVYSVKPMEFESRHSLLFDKRMQKTI